MLDRTTEAAVPKWPGSEKPFLVLSSESIVDFHLVGAGSGTQCFPFYTYAEDGSHRRENVTDWALDQFRSHYADPSITKWDIFGNRSALEWVIDQYQVSTDKRSGITNDPNREDDPTYILRLIGCVITVSLETVVIVNSLPT